MGYHALRRRRELILKVVICFVLVLNVSIGAFGIFSITRSAGPNSISTTANTAESFESTINEAYVREIETGKQTHDLEEKDPKTKISSLEVQNLLKPVVHLSGLDIQPVTKGFSNSDVIRNWADSRGSERHLLYNGPRYENGSLTIPANGFYFLYSHVKFYTKDNKKDDSNPRNFIHEIARFNINKMDQETVLTNRITECTDGINDGADLEYPSDVRGVLQLNAGDQIKVEVSHKDLMKHDIDWHNFGLYLI